ncbi:hypothetical protein DZS_18270 [Dickeya ananatis]
MSMAQPDYKPFLLRRIKKFYQLIKTLESLTGIPVVLNTSFNLAGMPIVESPDDAIECFRSAIGMDALFIGSYLLEKKQSL